MPLQTDQGGAQGAGGAGASAGAAARRQNPNRPGALGAFIKLSGADDAFLIPANGVKEGRGPGQKSGALEAASRAASGQALASGRAVATKVRLPLEDVALACAPLPGGGGDCVAALSRSLDPAGLAARVEAHLVWLGPALAAEKAFLSERERAAALEAALAGSGAVIELISRASGAADFEGALFHLAEDLRQVFGCARVLVACRAARGRLRIRGVSGVADLAKRGPGIEAAEALLDECAKAGVAIRPGDPRHPLARETLAAFGCGSLLASALREKDGRLAGGWVLLWETEPQDAGAVESLATASAPVVANLLRLLPKALPGPQRARVAVAWERLGREPQAVLAGILLGLAAVMLWPVPMPVEAEAEVAPKVRRVVSAPFDAVLRRAVAKAGQEVAEGQVLAVLDERELRWQLADAAARRSRALRQAEMALKEDRVAEARAAELDAESHAQQERLLADRLARLEVRSPLQGVVLEGDLERVEGAPLRAGEPMFEIAPMDPVIVRMFLSQADVAFVAPGQPAAARFESMPGRKWEGRVGRIFPKARERAGEAVFVAEMEMANPDAALRSGLKGRATVSTVTRPRCWAFLRGAWNWIEMRIWP